MGSLLGTLVAKIVDVSRQRWTWAAGAVSVAAIVLSRFLSRYLSRAVLGLKREPFPVEEWVSQYEEDAVDPDLAILDAHHHLWDPATQDKGWPIPKILIKLAYKFKPHLINEAIIGSSPKVGFTFGYRCPVLAPYMGRELLADIRGNGHGHNVVGTVYMECGWQTPGLQDKSLEPCKEADMVVKVHREFPQLCQALVAHADLRLGAAVEPALKYYQEKFTGKPMVRGIRHVLAWSPDERIERSPLCDKDTAYDERFREGFALLSKYGMHFETWCFHENIAGFTDLARTFPDTTMVLDHVGFPLGIGIYKLEETGLHWAALMVELAKCNNVYVKIGGLGMRFCGFGFDERPTPPSSDELAQAWHPIIDFTIKTFGVDRCIMESNFPMDKISCSYTVLFNALKKAASAYSLEDRRKLFELNARKLYKLDD